MGRDLASRGAGRPGQRGGAEMEGRAGWAMPEGGATVRTAHESIAS